MNARQGEHAPRGQWMATDGRELYHGWLVDLIERYKGDTDADYDRFLMRSDDPAETILSNLGDFSRQFSDQFVGVGQTHTAENMSVLLDSADKIKYYTSADDMLGESSNWHRAIKEHTRDGIRFASRVSLGLAYDAYRNVGRPIENTAAFYDGLSEVLHDSSFHEVLETFSTTGFSVLGNKVQHAMLSEDMPFVVSNMLGLGVSPVARIVHAARDENGKAVYRLNHRVAEKLIEKLREQNREHVLYRVGSYAIQQRRADRSFTTGCPVRRAPASELAKGNHKSGIALLAEHMGHELTRVAASRVVPQNQLQ